MHLFDQRILGVVSLLLLCGLVIVKQAATGSVLEKPGGNLIARLVNVFNLCFLLVVIPLTALLLLTRRLPSVDPTHIAIDAPSLLTIVEVAGLAVYGLGFGLMAAALGALGRNYQLGGSAPRSEDELVAVGPYRAIRHPMYTAALCISLGLACLIQSWALFGVFCIYVVLILRLIPFEEDGLRTAYGERYDAYQAKTKRLLPYIY